jgi:hypothetical protein
MKRKFTSKIKLLKIIIEWNLALESRQKDNI